MELDDVAEKTRRNVMLVSTGILAVWALGIPLDGKLIGAISLDAVQPWRAWLCALVVLGYFWLRCHLSPTRTEAHKAHQKKKAEERAERESAFLERQFANYIEKKPHWVKFVETKAAPTGQLPTLATSVNWLNEYSSGKVAFLWHFPEEDGGHIDWNKANIGRAQFHVPLPVRAGRWIWDHCRRIRNLTWDGLELSLPHFLTIFAAAVCLAKLAASLYYEFPFIRQLLSA
ncbi:hypothetical protein [Achromobacter pulmonis]|uniref:hypothetical protein n=1 Tax=Achromobacter pulmonis TaxID=1389932 RepID=UPI003C76F205